MSPSPSLSVAQLGAARRPAGLAVGFAALVGLTFVLIVLGALVRAHGAGLACPDWPLCFGHVVPRMDLEIAFEWTHRAVAGSVAIAFAGLAVAALRVPARPPGLGGLLVLAALLLAAQIVLGALTVWLKLASWTVTAHLLTGNAFAATLLCVALTLRDRAANRPARPAPCPAARLWLAASAVLLVIQLTLGGLVSSRYAGLACPEWPTCNGGSWFPSWQGAVGLHLAHRLTGYGLVACLAVWALVASRQPTLRRLAAGAAALGVLQVVVGVVNVWTGIPVEVTGLHSALAAALVLTLAASLREGFGPPARSTSGAA